MIAPQGGPTYYNRGVPDPRTPPTLNPFGPAPGTGGVNRPDPLFGWTSPYGPGAIGAPQAGIGTSGGQMSWPQPGARAPISREGFEAFGRQAPGEMPSPSPITPPGFSTPPGGTPQTPPGITPPFSWPPQGQTTSTSDTVPAWLTPKESVLTPGASDALGRGTINSLNNQYPPGRTPPGQAVTGFDRGGIVPPFVQNKVQNAMQNHPWMQRYAPQQVAQHYMQRRGGGMQAPMGYEGGIGYVPPSSVDPAWQNVNLQAPGMNIGALKDLAAQSRLSPQAISGLLQAVAQAYKRKQAMGTPQDGTSYGGFMGQSAASAPSGYDQGTSDVKKKMI